MAPCLAAGKYLVITHLKPLLKLSRGGGVGSTRKILLIASKKENADPFTLSKENRLTHRCNYRANVVQTQGRLQGRSIANCPRCSAPFPRATGKRKKESIASPLKQHRLTKGPSAQPINTFLTNITLRAVTRTEKAVQSRSNCCKRHQASVLWGKSHPKCPQSGRFYTSGSQPCRPRGSAGTEPPPRSLGKRATLGTVGAPGQRAGSIPIATVEAPLPLAKCQKCPTPPPVSPSVGKMQKLFLGGGGERKKIFKKI